MQFCTLFSGSSGNCAYLSTDRGGLLIDCGMSGKQTLEALRLAGLDLSSIHALLITHEHADHMKGAGVVSRKLNIPVYATEGTWEGMVRSLGELPKQHRLIIRPDESFFVNDVEAVPFHIPHDANDPTDSDSMSVSTALQSRPISGIFRSSSIRPSRAQTSCCWRATTIRTCS